MMSAFRISLALTLRFLTGIVYDTPQASLWRAKGLCYPGEDCFPTSETLAAFNQSIDGLLLSQTPIGSVCYRNSLQYDSGGCSELLQNMHSDQWRTDRFPSYQQVNWESCGGSSDSCYVPNPSNGSSICGQGSVPNYAVRAKTTEHVRAFIQFATKHFLRIVIKNTGHDFHGRSAGQGGFALWTHELDAVSHENKFIPKGCKWPSQNAIRLGAGVQWLQAYRYADSLNLTLVGGAKPQVGAAGGWLLGGGHSFLSPSYGLGVDNLLEAEIVTLNGEILTISECSNPELFWAIRGGGGATFGVLTSVVYKAYPQTHIHRIDAVPRAGVKIGFVEMERIVLAMAEVAPSMGDLGVGGALYVAKVSTSFRGALPGKTIEEFKSVMQPFFDAVSDLLVPEFASFPTYYDFFKASEGEDQTDMGFPQALSSRVVSRSAFTDNEGHAKNLTELAHVIRKGWEITSRVGVRHTFYIILAPPSRKGLSLDSTKVSLHPVWYESLWLVLYTASWDVTHPPRISRGGFQNVHLALEPLRALTPNSGAYINEADTYESEYTRSFWGDANYARLLKIKQQFDPENHMQVWQGVGSETSNSKIFRCYKPNEPV